MARPKDGNADGTATCDIGAYEYQADPLIAGFGPAAVIAGGPGFTLTLNGANFTAGSTLYWNSTSHAATLVDSTQLSVAISPSEIANGAVAQIRVVGADGKRSNLAPFSVNYPLPQITSISPNFVSPSGPPATLIVTGTHFFSTSEITLARYGKLPTTFVSNMQLRATLPEWIAHSGKLDVSVTNPAPGGGESNILTLDIGMQYVGSIGGGVPTVAVSGTLAYIGEGSELTILDVSNPATPARLGGLTTRERVQDIELAGNRLYLTDDHDGLLIVDVADPAHPQLLGSIDTPGQAYDVQVVGNRAYLADGEEGMRIIDVSDPAQPATLGFYDILPAYDLTIVGNIAYIATGTGRSLTLLDIGDPAHPTELTTWYSQYSTYGVQVVGGVAYVTLGNQGLMLLNVATPHS
ncbi:MAG: IPT/TIG domain-containing protein, partial [Chloroflexota bacterium]|nr:IPT/TIG domain-containing protein [Chloroflexota bacterium]